MGEYMKNKEKLRILREKTAARRAAAKAKKMAKKKGGASRSRRKTKKETSEKESDEEEEDLEKSEGDQEEDEEEDEEDISTKHNKRNDEKSLTGTEESEDEGFEDPETAAKIALNLLSNIAVRAVSPTKDRRSKDVSDDEGVVAIKSDTEKVEEKKSLKVVVRRLPVKK